MACVAQSTNLDYDSRLLLEQLPILLAAKEHSAYSAPLNPEPQNVNPKPQTLNPKALKPETLNPKPESQTLTLKPKPSIPGPKL